MSKAIDLWEKEALSALEQAYQKASTRMQEPLRSMLDYHFSSGGKRLRPLLVYAAARSYLPDLSSHWSALTAYALAVELVHNATLIHDDLQDGDRLRRGKETIWVKYSPAQAINCGNAWFFLPQILLQEERSLEHGLLLQLLRLLQEKTLAVVEGQAQEFALKEAFASGKKIDQEKYMQMVDGKTSALFSMPLLGGAMIAGASGGEIQDWENASLHLGRAFQIQDDLLDLWGQKGREQAGTDIAEGKLSYPVVLALGLLPEGDDRKRFSKALLLPRDETSQEDISWCIAKMESLGVKEKAKADFFQNLELSEKIPMRSSAISFISSRLKESVESF